MKHTLFKRFRHFDTVKLLLADDAQIIGKGSGVPGHWTLTEVALQCKDLICILKTGGTGAKTTKTRKCGQSRVETGRLGSVDAVANGQLITCFNCSCRTEDK